MDYRIDKVDTLLRVLWQKDSGSKMSERYNNGFVICNGSEFSFFVNGEEVIADSTHLLVLPKGATYNFRCRKSGVTYTYNFDGAVPGNIPYNIEHYESTSILSYAEELQKTSDMYTKTGLMYRIIGKALGGDVKESIPNIIRPQTEYIRSHFGNPEISNSYLASLTNISEIYFRKVFVRTFGVSPHEYITNLRMENSKQMLLSGRTVSETAAFCGFSNLYYFSAAFKKHIGISPTEYVKQNGVI